MFSITIVTAVAVSESQNDMTKHDGIQIEVKYKKVSTNKIIFNGNRGKIGSKKTVSVNIKKGTKIGKFPTTPKRNGYIFMGWYTKKTGGTKITKNTKPTKSVVYYAQWKDTPANYENKLKSLIKDNSVSVEAKNELFRILKVQLQNPEILYSLMKNKVKISIVPIGVYMTDLPEFKGLLGTSTFDGRGWKYTRGVSYFKYGKNIYVGVCEENLIGKDPQVEHPQNTNQMQDGYTKGYSTTTHEIAHAIHYYALSQKDQNIIKNCYAKTKRSGNWVDGPGKSYASSDAREYFAQLSNAYLGTNTGYDPFTNYPRHNGKEWIKNNDIEMYNLLKKIYKNGEVNTIYPDGRLKEGGVITNNYYK
jgi:uncharacterized repeat protein (TIGR02543 family)